MKRAELAQLADQLAPFLLPLIKQNASGTGGTAGTTTVGAHALDSATHTGTLSWLRVSKVGSSLADLQTRNYADLTARGHVLATNAGLGPDHTVSGLTTGHVLRASGATTAAFAQLAHAELTGVAPDQHHARQHSVTSTGDHTITGAAFAVLGATAVNTLGLLTPLADTTISTLEALLKSDASGGLRLQYMSTPEVRNPSGSITLNPTGTAVLPTGNIQKDMGDYNRKWRTLYAAELYVETLVAQSVISTIGGRVMVTPTSSLIADIASGTGTSITIDVKHNGFAVGEWLYMATAPGGVAQVEVLQVTAGPSAITGGYRYTVNRNQDGSGQNAWFAGDAVASLGNAVGTGYIDLTATTTAYSHLGPTITVYARSSTGAWTGVTPTVSMGNLRSWVDYGSNEYGFALGNNLTLTPTSGFSGMTGDRTNGLRLFNVDVALYSGATRTVELDNTTGLNMRAYSGAGLTPPNELATVAWFSALPGSGNPVARMYADISGSSHMLVMQAGLGSPSASEIFMRAIASGTVVPPSLSLEAGPSGASLISMSASTFLLDNASTFTLSATTVQISNTIYNNTANNPWFRTAIKQGGTSYASGSYYVLDEGRFSASGLRWDRVMRVESNGVMEVGRYIDFHETSGDTSDYSVRLTSTSNILYTSGGFTTDGQLTVNNAPGLFTWTGGYALQVSGGLGIHMGSANSGYIYRAGGTMRLAVDGSNVLALIDSSGGSNLYAVVGSSTALYSARLSVYGNIHSNGAVTGELYLQTAAGTTPGAAAGWARIALRSSDNALVAVMPSGAVRVSATN